MDTETCACGHDARDHDAGECWATIDHPPGAPDAVVQCARTRGTERVHP